MKKYAMTLSFSSPLAIFATLVALASSVSCTSAGAPKGKGCCGKTPSATTTVKAAAKSPGKPCCGKKPAQTIVVKEKTEVRSKSKPCCGKKAASKQPLKSTVAQSGYTNTGAATSPKPGCHRGVRAHMLVLAVEDMKHPADVQAVQDALGAMKGIMRVTTDRESGLVNVVADLDGPVDAVRLVKLLKLTGYHAVEASDAQYEAESEEARKRGAIVMTMESGKED